MGGGDRASSVTCVAMSSAGDRGGSGKGGWGRHGVGHGMAGGHWAWHGMVAGSAQSLFKMKISPGILLSKKREKGLSLLSVLCMPLCMCVCGGPLAKRKQLSIKNERACDVVSHSPLSLCSMETCSLLSLLPPEKKEEGKEERKEKKRTEGGKGRTGGNMAGGRTEKEKKRKGRKKGILLSIYSLSMPMCHAFLEKGQLWWGKHVTGLGAMQATQAW